MSKMRFSELACLGEAVEIRIGRISAKTTIQDILDGERFVILQPTHRLALLSVGDDEYVRIFLIRENGIFRLDAVLEARYRENGVALCRFRAVSEAERIQRRYSYRLHIVLDAKLYLQKGAKPLNAKTINISENGLCLVSSIKFEPLDKFTIKLKLEEGYDAVFDVQVIRCERINEDTLYTTGARFLNISTREQARLSRFIMKQQILQRKLSK